MPSRTLKRSFSQFGCRTSWRDRAVFLPSRDASPEKCFDKDHLLRDDFLKFGVVRRQLERCVDQHAPATLLIRHRTFDDLIKKRVDCRKGWQLFQAGNPVAYGRFKVMSQCLTIQRSFVAECVVKTGAGNPHFLSEIPNRGRTQNRAPRSNSSPLPARSSHQILLVVPSNASLANPPPRRASSASMDCILERLDQNGKTTKSGTRCSPRARFTCRGLMMRKAIAGIAGLRHFSPDVLKLIGAHLVAQGEVQ